MEEKAKNTPKKKPWKPMEIAKVPLDREQAVLTCCSQPDKAEVTLGPGTQCGYDECFESLGVEPYTVSS